jgi:hypothetical protein
MRWPETVAWMVDLVIFAEGEGATSTSEGVATGSEGEQRQ